MKRLAVLIFAVLFIVSCAQKEVVVPDQPPPPPKDTTSRDKDVSPKDTSKDGGDTTSIDKDSIKDRGLTEEEIRAAMQNVFKNVNFAYNRSDILDEAKPMLRKISDWMLTHNSVSILIEGHCDERGTSEYNLALGDQRAQATKAFLVSSGVPAMRMETVTFGKEKPLCPEHNETCWSKNRRASFVISR
ncbi:MAG: peptidoglycan-associated lipoprotein Pal [Candidatus Magnetobacterium sp. LHC-1]|uniref:Peptidoglycan-associated lipoprotein n=1 Tax=Candidatus Magnetobacterium casense TaxID=1455061 RepID=A0ABS6RXD1_9BACT|nr:peptidoglycan-associated lipoprotein Pal [Candidatus Magnetobacterium casensis]MBF0607279.1 peptidoglycan-associated lipoprotein Pal [Nitrospirota bacterium]MBV6341284.1 peptidoglycan-associated lipoprotein Pal [Candidatus Magnetobacterium casensis]